MLLTMPHEAWIKHMKGWTLGELKRLSQIPVTLPTDGIFGNHLMRKHVPPYPTLNFFPVLANCLRNSQKQPAWWKGSCQTQWPRGASCSQQLLVAVKCGFENWHCWRSRWWEVVLSGAGGLEGSPPWGLAGQKRFDRATCVGCHLLGA